jgi:hypothetical protein
MRKKLQRRSDFNEALRRVMRVSKDDLKEMLAREKAANADKPKRGPKAVHRQTSG